MDNVIIRGNVLFVRRGHSYSVLSASDVLYFEIFGKTVETHCREKVIDFHSSFCELEKLLPWPVFCRIHRSFIVNIEHITCVAGKNVLLSDGTVLPLGRRYAGNLLMRACGRERSGRQDLRN